jgi:hypothetical protein
MDHATLWFTLAGVTVSLARMRAGSGIRDAWKLLSE